MLWLQVPVIARLWKFESSSGHHSLYSLFQLPLEIQIIAQTIPHPDKMFRQILNSSHPDSFVIPCRLDNMGANHD